MTPQSPIYLLSSICNLVSIRLNDRNYVSWRFQMSSLLRAHSLIGYVDGTIVQPERFVRGENGVFTDQENPSFMSWLQYDQALMTLINATLSESAMSLVIGYPTAREAWLALERCFSSAALSNVIQLKTIFSRITQGSNSIDENLRRLKEAKDNLVVVDAIADDEDLLIQTLNGLLPDFAAFRTRSDTISLESLHVLLRAEEISMAQTRNQKQA